MASAEFVSINFQQKPIWPRGLPGWRRSGVFQASSALVVVLAALGHWADAARVSAASNAFMHRTRIVYAPSLQSANQHAQAVLAAAGCDAADLQRWQREGQALDEAAIEAICSRAAQGLSAGSGPFCIASA